MAQGECVPVATQDHRFLSTAEERLLKVVITEDSQDRDRLNVRFWPEADGRDIGIWTRSTGLLMAEISEI